MYAILSICSICSAYQKSIYDVNARHQISEPVEFHLTCTVAFHVHLRSCKQKQQLHKEKLNQTESSTVTSYDWAFIFHSTSITIVSM